MALNTGINSLDADAPDITYTGKEGPQDPRMASAYLGDKYIGMQDLVDEFKQRHGYDPLHDMNQWFKFLEMKRNDPEARLQERNMRTASAPSIEDSRNEMSLMLFGKPLHELNQEELDILNEQGARLNNRPMTAAHGGIAGTYTQRRRNQMAYGGIAGLDGRRRYGIGSWFQEKIMDPIKGTADKLIPNELKNPVVAAIAANYLPTAFGSPTVLGQLGEKFPTVLGPTSPIGRGIETVKGIPGSIMEAFTGPNVVNEELERVIGSPGKPHGTEAGGDLMKVITQAAQSPGFKLTDPSTWLGGITGAAGKVFGTGEDQWGKYTIPFGIGAAMGKLQQDYLDKQPEFGEDPTGFDVGARQKLARITSEAEAAKKGLHFVPQDKYRLHQPIDEQTLLAAEGGRIGYERGRVVNPGGYAGEEIFDEYGLDEMGLWDKYAPTWLGGESSKLVGAYKEMEPNLNRLEKINSELARIEGMGDAGEALKDQVTKLNQEKQEIESQITLYQSIEQGLGKAQGGRIGYADPAGLVEAYEEHMKRKRARERYEQERMPPEELLDMKRHLWENYRERFPRFRPEGERTGAQEGGLMNLGGMEKDYRQEGGFVPIGGQEKADDVPARLSKNEFVFTADAVRAAGGGDIDAGAEVMENVMENLEAGGKVSEESQGLEGARNMFANAQQLEKRII